MEIIEIGHRIYTLGRVKKAGWRQGGSVRSLRLDWKRFSVRTANRSDEERRRLWTM